MDKSKKSKRNYQLEHQFQIRKIPLRRIIPQKNPQLYALDVHSICLPSRSKKAINWGSIHYEHQYEEQYNPQIINSSAYQQLFSQYLALKEKNLQQKNALKEEVQKVEGSIYQEEQKQKKLSTMKQGLYGEIEKLRQELNEVRDKNYNLRWEIYHQRGAHYMNVNGYSLLHDGEMSYQQLLQMQEQMGSMPKGLTEKQISQIPKTNYHIINQTQQICCICFDELNDGEEIPNLACKHVHHFECLRDWLLKQKVCPICKQQINPN